MKLISTFNHTYSHYHSVLVAPNFVPSRKFILLDRDGVIIEDVHHIVDPSKVDLMFNSASLINSAIEHGYTVAILTNQSVIARGVASIEDYIEVTNRMFDLLSLSCLPHIVLASFWHPSFSQESFMSNWRKPNDGMFQFLSKNFGLNPNLSFMIGDKLSDLQPAFANNISRLVHIHTDNHPNEKRKVEEWAANASPSIAFLDSLPSTLPFLLRCFE